MITRGMQGRLKNCLIRYMRKYISKSFTLQTDVAKQTQFSVLLILNSLKDSQIMSHCSLRDYSTFLFYEIVPFSTLRD